MHKECEGKASLRRDWEGEQKMWLKLDCFEKILFDLKNRKNGRRHYKTQIGKKINDAKKKTQDNVLKIGVWFQKLSKAFDVSAQ